MCIVSVNFAKQHKDMIARCRNLISSGLVTIYPKERSFDKLITSLRTAVDNEGVLDKDATSYNDIFDAFRLAMKFYKFEQQEQQEQQGQQEGEIYSIGKNVQQNRPSYSPSSQQARRYDWL